MRREAGFYERLWTSGEVWRAAAQAANRRELAQLLGVTANALDCGLAGLRDQGFDVPPVAELLRIAKRFGQNSPPAQENYPDLEMWDVEKTSPDNAPIIDPIRASERNDNFQDRDVKVPAADIRKVDNTHEPSAGVKFRAQELEPVEEHQLKRKVSELKAENKRLLETVASLREQNEIVEAALQHRVAPIVPRERTSGLREGTPVFLISDLHLEERVVPAKVQNLNCFTLDIARHRMRRLAEGIRWFIDSQRQDFLIRDVCLWIGGDTFTGHLHPDNIESTQLAPPAAFAFSKQLLEDVIDNTLADPQIERLVIPMNDGNHSRLTKELRAATRVEHSLEWLMYALIAEKYRDNPRVQFEIAQGDHLYTEVQGLTVRWTHGAEINYGGGVGGMTVPLNKAIAQFQTHRRADLTCLGHFHTRLSLRHIEANSSLIGFSPYALRIKAAYEEPTQSAFMIDSKRGKSVSAPIWVSDDEERALWAA